ncbi:uncharacterized protein V6R79_012252 [Siganus canaliculatus]
MIIWLLLVSLFPNTSQDRQQTGVCLYGPQNLTLTGSDQEIKVTWEDHPSCSKASDELIYELMILIADKQEHHVEITVTPDQIASIHSWKWSSPLMVECAPHSVKLRSRYKKQASPWKEEQILPENPELPEVFPKDRVFKVDSTVTFCCIVPIGQRFTTMKLQGNDSSMNKTKPSNINNQIYTLTVKLNQASQSSCTNVICKTEETENGACAYIGYPPDDHDLHCETRDLESVDCHWTVGRMTHVSRKSPTIYHLQSSTLDLLVSTTKSRCAEGSKGRCSHKVRLDVGERKWTLTAENGIGKVELSDSADLTQRVHLFAPKNLRASLIQSRNVTLEWEWEVQQYYRLDIRCQFNISHSETNKIIEKSGVGLHYTVLNDLIPHWTYSVTARCGTTQHFWKWGDRTSVDFLTKGDVPDALDVWMQKKEAVLIMWKLPLANQSHGLIEYYEVTWAKTTEKEQQNRIKVHDTNKLCLTLESSGEYHVTVTARNVNGSSFPSTITIPRRDRTESVPIYRINGSDGSFNLSWSASPDASCGYIVEWSPTLGRHKLDWLKVPLNESTARIYPKRFTDGIRYFISVYACTQGAPVLLERREGYIRQKKIEDNLLSLKWKQLGSDVEVFWEPINQKDQSAFIQGYVLYCLDNKNNVICNVSTVGPDSTRLRATRLPIGSYTFIVKALTELGECGSSFKTATLNSLTDDLVKPVLISLLSCFCLLSIITILLYRHWTCIIQNIYPPIPKPVLTGKWLTSMDESTYQPFHMDPCHYNEEDVATVTELRCSSKELENDSFDQEIVPFVLSQAPKGYYNQKTCSQPLLPMPSAEYLSQPESPSSQFRTVFPNPSYNLILQTGEQQFDPELGNGTPVDSSGYQPQKDLTTENPGSDLTCDFAYFLVPPLSPN